MILEMAFLVMTVVAVAFLIVPLVRTPRGEDLLPREGINTLVFRDRLRELEDDRAGGRVDEEAFLQLRGELEKSLLADVEGEEVRQAAGPVPRWAMAAIVMAVPALSLGVYFWKGQNDTVEQWLAARDRWLPVISASLKGREITEEEGKDLSSADYIHVLQSLLQESPDDADGWRSLGIAYLQVGLPAQAETAFRHAAELVPTNADFKLLVVEAKLAGGRGALDDAGMELLREVLTEDASNPKARMMFGMAAYNRKDFTGAITVWEELLADVPADSEGAAILRSSIEKARAKRDAGDAPAGPRLRVSVTVDEAVARDFPKPAFLMVYAKQVDGLPMPVAITKLPFDRASLTVELSDAEAMAPMAKLSTSKTVRVFARLSRTGTAAAQVGDALAESAPVTVEPRTMDVALLVSEFVK
jgi:cytochrome c-type biogenesis protein CcmH